MNQNIATESMSFEINQPSPNSTAEEIRKKYLNHEVSIKSIGILYFTGAIVIGVWKHFNKKK